MGKLYGNRLIKDEPEFELDLDGCHFKNPIGLAAGFDKGASIYPHLSRFGFGFVEVGTLTPKAQPGNPQPRLFRLPDEEALLNRMGFNNPGVEHAKKTLEKYGSSVPLGINLGKNKLTPNAEAVDDYVKGFKALSEFSDYMVVNVSSPNTPGLRELQDKTALDEIFSALNEINTENKPIWLKIAPDLTEHALDDIVEIILKRKIYGFIATNTTLDRSSLPGRLRVEPGGVSGRPLKDKSDHMLKLMSHRLFGKCKIMGVGGVFTADDVAHKIALGADLVQVYTGWIYRGPTFVRELLKGLHEILQRDGLTLSTLRGKNLNH